MTRKFQRLAAGWMLVASALVSASSGMVLCIGDDGHIAVEPKRHGDCGHTHDAAGQEHDGAALWEAGSAACEAGGCVDVPMESDSVSQATKNSIRDRLIKNSVSQEFLAGCKAFVQTGVHGYRLLPCEAMPHVSPSLLEKRTIVLLI